jgi:hypothetical protein
MNSYKYLFFLFRKLFANIIWIITFPFQLIGCLFVYITSYQEDSEKNLPSDEKELGLLETETDTKKELLQSVSIKTGKRLHIIPISEIVCIQAYGDYVNIMTLKGVYLKEQTLKYFIMKNISLFITQLTLFQSVTNGEFNTEKTLLQLSFIS